MWLICKIPERRKDCRCVFLNLRVLKKEYVSFLADKKGAYSFCVIGNMSQTNMSQATASGA